MSTASIGSMCGTNTSVTLYIFFMQKRCRVKVCIVVNCPSVSLFQICSGRSKKAAYSWLTWQRSEIFAYNVVEGGLKNKKSDMN